MPPQPPTSPPLADPSPESSQESRSRASDMNSKQKQKQHDDDINLPQHLRDSDSSEDEIASSQGPPLLMNMNQSIFGLISSAGAKADFIDRFNESSSDDDDDPGSSDDDNGMQGGGPVEDLSKTTILQPPRRQKKRSSRKMRPSGHKLLQSLPVLPKLRSKPRSAPSQLAPTVEESDEPASETNSPSSPPTRVLSDGTDRLPVMSRMLEARAEVASRPSFDLDSRDTGSADDDNATLLARRLMDIFGFDEPEQVTEEYPCWLLQNVLLQGFLYITACHVCFYAYLPKKTTEVSKSGFLSKSGKRSPKYSRFWFRLKGDVLSYYHDSTNIYFPHGQIDLRYGISAAITDEDKDGLNFEVVTHHRTYNLRAESAANAKEWVKSLQKVIFRSHNDGDSVKIAVPIANIMDVEEIQMAEFAHTCKIRVIDSDETYAMDEYFFAFFSLGTEAIDALKQLVEERNSDGDADDGPNRNTGSRRPFSFSESVKTTHSPTFPQSMFPGPGMASHSGSRRSSANHPDDYRAQQQSALSESYVQSSTEDPSFSNLADSSAEDPSASQILKDSEVFHQSPVRVHGIDPVEGRAMNQFSTPTISTYSGQPSGKGEASDDKANKQQRPAQSLQEITKMGTYPLERAGALADYLNKTQQQMRTLITAESMGYVEKVSGMWKGARKHYDEPDGLRVDDDLEPDSEGKLKTFSDRFRAHFALPEDEKLQATYFGHIFRVLPLYGKIYISDRSFCFRSLIPGTRTKLILPLQDIETVHKEKGFRLGYSGLVIVIRGHEELFFEFGQGGDRDDCAVTLLRSIEDTRYLLETGSSKEGEKTDDKEALPPGPGSLMPTSKPDPSAVPTIMDEADASWLNFKPKHPMKITCLTIGSRGDVQPYIALCKGLIAEGHKPRIATHAEFQGWIESYGIEFAPVAGDPADLMRLCIEHGTFTWAFLREANKSFRGWLDGLLLSAVKACEGSDLLIESPSAMAGIHIAEKLQIPYFRAFTMPWTLTRAYPHAFMPQYKMGGGFNHISYVLFDSVFWKAIEHQVNRWRNKVLGLPNISQERIQQDQVPFLYNFSPKVVPPPLDFPHWIKVTGYWFLDEGDKYKPPDDLLAFIKKAREDGKKIVYVGFGSIIVEDTHKMTNEVIEAVLKADVRCILSKGWSERVSQDLEEKMEAPATVEQEPKMPSEIHVIKSAPHDWLFRQIDAAAHHGGSGTTGASLRAGLPTIIRPFFGDQHFFANRVEDLGVGVHLSKWGVNSFGRALWEVTRNERLIVKARVLGENIRKENGVDAAIQQIYRDLSYAKRLVLLKAGKGSDPESRDDDDDDGDDEAEEEDIHSWTMVGDSPDPTRAKKLSEDVAKGRKLEGSPLGARGC